MEQEVNTVSRNLVGELILKIYGLVGCSIAEERVGWRSRERWSTGYLASLWGCSIEYQLRLG